MTGAGKVIVVETIALVAAIVSLGTGYHYHEQTVDSLTTQLTQTRTESQTKDLKIQSLNYQVTSLSQTVESKQKEIELARTTSKHEVIVQTGITRTTTIDTASSTQETSTTSLLLTVTSQLVVLQQQLDKISMVAETSTAEVQSLTSQLHEQTVDVSKSAARWQFGADLAPKVFGLPVDEGTPAVRISAGAFLGPFLVGVDAAPAWPLATADPRLSLRWSL